MISGSVIRFGGRVLVLLVTALGMACKVDLSIKPEPSLRMKVIDLAKQEAAKGNTSADCYLGWVYATGNGTLKDTGLGKEHLVNAEKAEHKLASRLLKVLPETNEDKRFEVMVAVVRTFASEGDPDAQFIMASWVAFGDGLAPNLKEARRQMGNAAANGNKFASMVGALLENGNADGK